MSLRQQMRYGFAVPVLIVLLASAYVSRALGDMRGGASAATLSTETMGLRYVILTLLLDAIRASTSDVAPGRAAGSPRSPAA